MQTTNRPQIEFLQFCDFLVVAKKKRNVHSFPREHGKLKNCRKCICGVFVVCICGLFVVYMWSICGIHVVCTCLVRRPTAFRRIGSIVCLNCGAPRAGARSNAGGIGRGLGAARVLLVRAALLRLGLPQLLGLLKQASRTRCLYSRNGFCKQMSGAQRPCGCRARQRARKVVVYQFLFLVATRRSLLRFFRRCHARFASTMAGILPAGGAHPGSATRIRRKMNNCFARLLRALGAETGDANQHVYPGVASVCYLPLRRPAGAETLPR